MFFNVPISAMKLTKIIALIGVLLLSTSCASDEASYDEGSKGLFYEVEGGENQVYLFGSVHVGKEDMYPLHPKVEEAFQESEVLGLEIDMADMTEMELGQQMAQLGMYHDGTQMTDIISEDTFDEVADIAITAGIDENTLNQFQPWYGALLVTELGMEEAGLSSEYGIESYFLDQLEDEDMETVGLETIQEQLGPYNEMSDESQRIYLENTLDEMEHIEEDLNELITYWEQGDRETFAEMREEQIQEAETESLQEFQLATWDNRDEQMAESIEEALEEASGNTYFMVVGSMHLAGENSIVEQLEDRGYEVNLMY